MGNRMPELTLSHAVAGFNSYKMSMNLGSEIFFHLSAILFDSFRLYRVVFI